MTFNDFWTWLTEQPRTLPTLGSQNNGFQADPEELALEEVLDHAEGLAVGDLLTHPGRGFFSIQAITPHAGHVRVPSGNYHPFDLSAGQATWHRFHGLRATTAKLLANGVALHAPYPHQRTSSYIRPTNMAVPSPQNWLDCPQPITSPCYIAATIRVYCNTLPNANIIYPAA